VWTDRQTYLAKIIGAFLQLLFTNAPKNGHLVDQEGDGKITLWEDNIKMVIREVPCEDGRWMRWLRIVSSGGLWY
jgi:hypothetical protein